MRTGKNQGDKITRHLTTRRKQKLNLVRLLLKLCVLKLAPRALFQPLFFTNQLHRCSPCAYGPWQQHALPSRCLLTAPAGGGGGGRAWRPGLLVRKQRPRKLSDSDPRAGGLPSEPRSLQKRRQQQPFPPATRRRPAELPARKRFHASAPS